MSMLALTQSTQNTEVPSLETLFAQAENYGVVNIFSDKSLPNRAFSYRASIHFFTAQGIDLEAKSEFGMSLPAALTQAIERAEQIRSQFK